MGEAASPPHDIKIVTWPALWMYWPIYLALARTQKQFGKAIKFSLDEITSENVTDQYIRGVFYEAVIRGESVIALCEPLETHVPRSGLIRSNDPAKIKIRRVPAIWRLPHWLLWCETAAEGSSTTFGEKYWTIWAYPRRTTSGDFVRTAIQTLPMFRGTEHRINALSPDLAEERTHVEGLFGEMNMIATFTPWHVVLGSQPGTERLKQNMKCSLLPGPSHGVTAVLIPDIDEQWVTVGAHSIAEYIARHLKSILGELSDTHGDFGLILEFFGRTNNLNITREFLKAARPSEKGEPQWLDPLFLGAVLGEYVRLGCYFPYRNLDSAVTTEIQKRIDNVLEDFRRNALESIQNHISEFFGNSLNWCTLSFSDRLRVWRTASPLDLGHTLTSQLTHPETARETLGVENVLNAITVSPTEGMGRVSLLSLTTQHPLECSRNCNGTDHKERSTFCFPKAYSSGRAARDELEYSERPCVNCVLGGVPRSFLRPAAERLAQGLEIEIAFRTAEAYEEVIFAGPCPICLEDIETLIEVFIRERRTPTPGTSPACELVLYNGFNGITATDGGLILFGIWWRGSTEQHSGTGRASASLGSWSKALTAAGKEVAWVGFWRGSEAVAISRSDHPAERSALFVRAFGDFVAGEFVFGYVAVFRVEGVDHGLEET